MKTLVKLLAVAMFALLTPVGFAHNGGGHAGGFGHSGGAVHYGGHPGYFHNHGLGFRGFYPWPFYGYAPYYGWYYDPSYYSDYPSYDHALTLAKKVQETLAAEGFYSGKIDGIVGPATRTAIRRYQARAHLPVSGVIDRALIHSMGLD